MIEGVSPRNADTGGPANASRSSRASALAALVSMALVAFAAACASQGQPPGGPEDLRPPVVLSTDPDTFAIVEPGVGRIRIRFNERISERARSGTLNEAVTISPRTGEVRVSHQRDGLDVELQGGFRPGVVYRVTVEPVIVDMFNNPMAVPFEFAFSTGPAFEENAVVGMAFDRVTGQAVSGANVIALPGEPTADTLVQVARVDDEGIFAFRFLAAGRYLVTAFIDRNGDGQRQPTEAGGRAAAWLGSLGRADTTQVLIPILQPDTTMPVLVSAEVVDSSVIRVTLDDFLDPNDPMEFVRGGLRIDQEVIDSMVAQGDSTGIGSRAAAAGTALPPIVEALHPFQYQLRLDSAAALADTTGTVDFPGEPPASELLPNGERRPSQEVLLIFAAPIPSGIPLIFRVDGLVNLNGMPDGGGETKIMRLLPVAADSLEGGVGPADSLASPPDTATQAIDTFRVARLLGGGPPSRR